MLSAGIRIILLIFSVITLLGVLWSGSFNTSIHNAALIVSGGSLLLLSFGFSSLLLLRLLCIVGLAGQIVASFYIWSDAMEINSYGSILFNVIITFFFIKCFVKINNGEDGSN
jgi:hypothetical protein